MISSMEYADLLKDFVGRTRRNLELTDALPRQGDTPFFEVTQLINSLLGLIVLPRELMLDALPNTPLDRLDESWPKLHLVDGPEARGRPGDLRQLVKGLRNAVGHLNIDYKGDGTRITGVRLKSAAHRSAWAIDFDLKELRRFVERLAIEIERTLSNTPAGLIGSGARGKIRRPERPGQGSTGSRQR